MQAVQGSAALLPDGLASADQSLLRLGVEEVDVRRIDRDVRGLTRLKILAAGI